MKLNLKKIPKIITTRKVVKKFIDKKKDQGNQKKNFTSNQKILDSSQDNSLQNESSNAQKSPDTLRDDEKEVSIDKKFESVTLKQTEFYTDLEAKKLATVSAYKLYLEQLEALVLKQQEKAVQNSEKFNVVWDPVSATREKNF